MKFKFVNRMHVVLVLAVLSSNGCAALTGMLGSMGGLMGGASGAAGALGSAVPTFQGLTEQQGVGDLMMTSNDVSAGRIGYVVKASGSLDPSPEGNKFYGLFKDPSIR